MNPYLLNQVEEMKRVDGLQSTSRLETMEERKRAPDLLAVQLLDLEHEIGDWICSPLFPSL